MKQNRGRPASIIDRCVSKECRSRATCVRRSGFRHHACVKFVDGVSLASASLQAFNLCDVYERLGAAKLIALSFESELHDPCSASNCHGTRTVASTRIRANGVIAVKMKRPPTKAAFRSEER